MKTRVEFLAAIAAAPGDALLRLMFADWLEEHGSPLAELWRTHEPHRCPVIKDFDYYSKRGDAFGWGDGDGYGNSCIANDEFSTDEASYGDGRPYKDTPDITCCGRYHGYYLVPLGDGHSRHFRPDGAGEPSGVWFVLGE